MDYKGEEVYKRSDVKEGEVKDDKKRKRQDRIEHEMVGMSGKKELKGRDRKE